jgi:Na+/melibiose symporter-like transporter
MTAGRIWRSILFWAALQIALAMVFYAVVRWLGGDDTSRMIAALTGVITALTVRKFARSKGWAMKSYAPDRDT